MYSNDHKNKVFADYQTELQKISLEYHSSYEDKTAQQLTRWPEQDSTATSMSKKSTIDREFKDLGDGQTTLAGFRFISYEVKWRQTKLDEFASDDGDD